jgi:hypothetical protein
VSPYIAFATDDKNFSMSAPALSAFLSSKTLPYESAQLTKMIQQEEKKPLMTIHAGPLVGQQLVRLAEVVLDAIFVERGIIIDRITKPVQFSLSYQHTHTC